MRRWFFFLALIPFLSSAQQPVDLIPAVEPLKIWRFNNGQEFPGATGGLEIDEGKDGRVALKLIGDFTGGGGYVEAGRRLDGIDVRELSFWVKSEEAEQFTLRLGDGSGQTHQIKLKMESGTGWRRIVFPLEDFFKRRGKSDAVTGITKYEYWGGAKDGNWHGPAKGIYLLLPNGGANRVRTLWVSGLQIEPKAQPVAGVELRSELPLLEIVDGVHDWLFSHGAEFKGAKGSLDAVDGQTLKLSGDFTGGGAYVAAIRDMESIGEAKVPAIRMRLKTDNAKSLTVQLVDSTGQTHQRKALPVTADGQWHDFEIVPAKIAGGEHWGGVNDGKWHDPPRRMVISLTIRSDSEKKPELQISDVRAESIFPVFADPAAFASREPITLTRTLEQVNEPRLSEGPRFDAAPGQWQISFAYRSDLHSPDNSYSGVLLIEAFDSAGTKLDTITLADVFGKQEETQVNRVIELPKGTQAARFVAKLNKAHGEFDIKNLSAAYLAPAPRRDDRIERILFSTARLGNLLYPGDSREIGVTVQARKPLPATQKTLRYMVRDYWGAEHMELASVTLDGPAKEKNRFIYQANLDLSSETLETGRYYELHAEIGRESNGGVRVEPFRNHTSFAILPEAGTKQHDPIDVPFTARNWDNRISEYIRLTDRLGIRICGLWGGWKNKPPYSPEVPGLELCRELGMGWLTTTPCKFIEGGKDADWTEEALRQGARNFVEAYGNERPLIINLGNEPHGTGDRVRKNVAAYRTVYEAIKSVDPTIPVVATSVEPNEEYFKNGYGQWCDAYDFHIYEHYTNVRRTMEHYRELMEKYDVVRPIWSTELGLNSQGQPRRAVSRAVIKKFATFFAAGGENVSWFGLLYPDREGKNHGSSGDSHNVFDCRFNRYAPRMDAVTLYHAVNAISIKKFVEEKHYPEGVDAFLFRDGKGRCLQVLWNDDGRSDVFLPLPGVGDVELIYIDGSRTELNAGSEGLTLGVSSDPVMLLYQDPGNGLADKLGEPKVAIANLPAVIERSGVTEIVLDTDEETSLLSAPPFWEVKRDGLRFQVMPPSESEVRFGELTVSLPDGRGEIRFRTPLANN